MVWGQPASPLGRPTCYLPLYKYNSFLVALGLRHNTKQPSKFEIAVQNFIVEIPLVEVVWSKKECEEV